MNIIINTMDRAASNGFVTTVHWTVTKTQGEHIASQYGTESFTQEGSFKPFNQLTEAEVKGWLTASWGTEGVAAKEAALDAQLAAMANPPVLNGVPWA